MGQDRTLNELHFDLNDVRPRTPIRLTDPEQPEPNTQFRIDPRFVENCLDRQSTNLVSNDRLIGSRTISDINRFVGERCPSTNRGMNLDLYDDDTTRLRLNARGLRLRVRTGPQPH